MRDPGWKKPDPPLPACHGRLRAMARQILADVRDHDQIERTRGLPRDQRAELEHVINEVDGWLRSR